MPLTNFVIPRNSILFRLYPARAAHGSRNTNGYERRPRNHRKRHGDVDVSEIFRSYVKQMKTEIPQSAADNRKNRCKHEIDRFGDALQTFADMLRREDTPAITQYLQQAAMRRRELVHEKHTH